MKNKRNNWLPSASCLTNAVAQCILNKANLALLLGPATEGPWGILTDKIGEAVMSTSLTLVNIWYITKERIC